MKVVLNTEKFLLLARDSHMTVQTIEHIANTYEERVIEINEDLFMRDGKYKVYNFDGFSVREDCLTIQG